ncbi:MAG TPA: hypothetical protein VFN46_00820, partial [Acetobacteraceae bacterium]|nr:hypothetical protein [Acetobacteraceae bacterium]
GAALRPFAALLAAALLCVARPAPAAEDCPTTASVTVTTRPLPHLAEALRPGSVLDVLALGSASLLGPRGGVAGSVPEHMIEVLRAAVPGVTIRLTLRAGRTESADDMLTTLKAEVPRHAYQLVLWQTGSVEALRHSPVEPFGRALHDGIATATSSGADLVLIDMQFSRLIDQHAELTPYRTAMTEAALQPDVMLFPRYALTRAWAEDGAIDLEATGRGARRDVAAKLRACLGTALAHMLLQAARMQPGP